MYKNRIFPFFIFLILAETLFAQSFYDAQGNTIATKICENQLDVTGSVFMLENGRMIEMFDGQRREDLGVNYSLREDNRVDYFNRYDMQAGYYVPSENRYYRVDAIRGKEDHIALLYEGFVYTINETPTFQVDSGFDPEWIGFILFFFLGY